MHITHVIAELECSLIGHQIPKRKNTPRPAYIYPGGAIENMGDYLCDNCGHFITLGLTRVRNPEDADSQRTPKK